MTDLIAEARQFDLVAEARSLDLAAERRGFDLIAPERALTPPVAGNGLLNNLIAYWPGNELAGNALDLHVNALHLNDINTVTSNPGLSYPLARQYTRVNTEYHQRPGDDALLSVADLDFTLAALVNFDTVGIASKWIANKRSTVPNNGYQLTYFGADFGGPNLFQWGVFNAGASGSVSAVTPGLPVAGGWYLVIGWHDSVADTVNIQVNNGGADSAVWAGGAGDDASRFTIGGSSWGAGLYMDGRISPTMFWKSAPGVGGVLTAAQRTQLWNGGTPLTYVAFTV